MKLIYTTVFEGNSNKTTGIYETQVLQFLSEIQNKHSVFLIPIIVGNLNKEFKKLLDKYNVDYQIIYLDKKIELFNKKKYIEYKKIVSNFSNEETIIMCREVLATSFAILSQTGLKIILDKRGIPYLESLTFKKHFLLKKYVRYLYFYFVERFVINKCKYFRFVSKNMANYYKNKYPNKINSYIIQPTGVLFNRTNNIKLRMITKWQNPGKYKIIYSGGNSNYHNFEEVIKFMKDISIKNDLFEFYVCSYFTESELNEYKNKYKFINFYNKLPHDNLVELLIDCNFGICFRSNSLINRIAAPTKISEYLAYNIKVIYSGNIGSVSDFIDELSDEYLIDKYKFSTKCINNIDTLNIFDKYVDFKNQADYLCDYLQNDVLIN